MQTTQANVVVDVKPVLSGGAGDELLSELRRAQGVTGVRTSPRTRGLVLVDYDPKIIDSQAILQRVVQRGFYARLVGM